MTNVKYDEEIARLREALLAAAVGLGEVFFGRCEPSA